MKPAATLPLNVLVVDDDEDTSMLLGLFIRRQGWVARFAATLAQARTALESGEISALVTDMRLPDGSGLSLLASGRPPSLRAAVVVTGGGADADRRESARSGFDAFLEKPFDGAKLVALLTSLLAASPELAPRPAGGAMTLETPLASSGASCHAFVADDDDDTRMLMAGALRRAGFEVREASDGHELVASFAAFASARDVIISDIGMPNCDGIQATLALKKLAPGTPILLVTAFADPSRLDAAREAGADEILRKPLDLIALVQSALTLCNRAHP